MTDSSDPTPPQPEQDPKVAKFEKLIRDYMEDTACTIPALVKFCAENMARLEGSRRKPKGNKAINKTPNVDK